MSLQQPNIADLIGSSDIASFKIFKKERLPSERSQHTPES
jgi:hypothetical protein